MIKNYMNLQNKTSGNYFSYLPLVYLLIFWIFQSCNTTTAPSKKVVSEISNLHVEILIEDGTKEKSLNKIKAYLSDGESRISNDSITILLNGKPLDFINRTGNFYDSNPVYFTDSLERKESYYFEIILPDSTKYPVAYIKPNKATSEFDFPENLSHNQDFVLEWRNNNALTQVELWKLVHEKANPTMHSGGRYSESTIHKTIKDKKGRFKVSQSFYKDSLTVADYLKMRISSKESGLTNPQLLPNSEIVYTYVVEKTIEIKDQ